MFDRKIFADRVARLRKEADVSQQTMAEAIGTTKVTISRIETGQRAVSVEMLCAIADYFNVSIDYLVGRTDIVR